MELVCLQHDLIIWLINFFPVTVKCFLFFIRKQSSLYQSSEPFSPLSSVKLSFLNFWLLYEYMNTKHEKKMCSDEQSHNEETVFFFFQWECESWQHSWDSQFLIKMWVSVQWLPLWYGRVETSFPLRSSSKTVVTDDLVFWQGSFSIPPHFSDVEG